jgi:tocopherol O-methyltransferase
VQDIKTADWSQEVAPFWGAVIKSALSAEGFSGLFKAGWTTIKVHARMVSCLLLHPARKSCVL